MSMILRENMHPCLDKCNSTNAIKHFCMWVIHNSHIYGVRFLLRMVDRWHQMNEKRLLMGNNAISGRIDSKDSRNRTRWVDIVAVIGNQYFSQVVEKHIRGAFGEIFSCLHILHLPFESQNFSIVCLPRKSPWIMLLTEIPQAKSVKKVLLKQYCPDIWASEMLCNVNGPIYFDKEWSHYLRKSFCLLKLKFF